MSSHYFAEEPTAPDRRVPVHVRAWGHDLQLASAPGVFSQGRLDPGTAVLLRSAAPSPPAGPAELLDLGCGYGVIACALALQVPAARVWAVDVNARARELTAENAAAVGAADRVRVCAPDDMPGDVRFDDIW